MAVTLVTSAVLLMSVSYLTQCSAPPQPPSPSSKFEEEHEGKSASGTEREREKAAGEPKSARELAEEEGGEEREKIQRVGRALQTIGANPELSKTLGIPP